MGNHPPRFLCDEMLKGPARWLRMADYDVQLSDDGVSDRVMLDQAQAGSDSSGYCYPAV